MGEKMNSQSISQRRLTEFKAQTVGVSFSILVTRKEEQSHRNTGGSSDEQMLRHSSRARGYSNGAFPVVEWNKDLFKGAWEEKFALVRISEL